MVAAMDLLHPLFGLLTIVFSVWVMSRGLRARSGGKPASAARRAHRRWAPWAFAAMVAAAVSGSASTVWLRPDLTLGETWHLAVGWSAVAVMGVAGLLTRAFTRRPSLRAVHPWLGIVAVVLALVQGLLGIELLP
jgi:Protein of unknown function (DUF4079)